MSLAKEKCVPCKIDCPRVTGQELKDLLKQLPQWKVVKHDGMNALERAFEFKDFMKALAFTNKVGKMAESQDHHPALLTEWGRTTVTFWTHKIRGLHRNDFIAAAKTDKLFK